MNANELLNEWHQDNPRSSYWIPEGACCDNCGKPLTADERWRNVTENEEQDGNAVLCDDCND